MRVFLRLLAEVAALSALLYWVYWFSIAGMAWFCRPVLSLLFYGGYVAHLLLLRDPGRGRWTFDVWLGAGLLGVVAAMQLMIWRWPLDAPRVRGWNMVLDDGEGNWVLLPYLHAAFWWVARAGGGCARRRYGRSS